MLWKQAWLLPQVSKAWSLEQESKALLLPWKSKVQQWLRERQQPRESSPQHCPRELFAPMVLLKTMN
jgi:hypothetical protein